MKSVIMAHLSKTDTPSFLGPIFSQRGFVFKDIQLEFFHRSSIQSSTNIIIIKTTKIYIQANHPPPHRLQVITSSILHVQ
jgi:hypothetical protein